MSAKQELQSLVGLLSESECKHLIGAVQDVAAGERFWEMDAGISYNEFVKLRSSIVQNGSSNGGSPATEMKAGVFAPIPITKCYTDKERIALPQPVRLSAEFSDVITQRRSRRDYSGAAITLEQLSTLLYHACGVTGYASSYGYHRLSFRTFPSSGGLQSSELYLFAHAVEELTPGLYHYRAVDHVLELLDSGDQNVKLRAIGFDQTFFETSAVVFALTGYYERLRWKYQERSYRYMCVDAGFVAENIYLAAEALGLGACAVSGFSDGAIEELLDIDGKNEMALLLLSLGVLSAADSNKPA